MVELRGNSYAPGSARPEEAVLRLCDHAAIELVIDGETLRYSAQEVKISNALGDLPRDFRFPDGRKFDCPENPKIREWLAVHDLKRGSRWVQRLERRWRWVVISVVVVGFTAFAMVVWGIPASAGWLSQRVPAAVRVEMGDHSMILIKRLLGERVPREEIPIDLETPFTQMAAPFQNEGVSLRLDFYVGDTIGPNAFAVPNGQIIMTDEFIDFAREDSVALVGVLAHEIGHLVHRHGTQRAIQAASLPMLITLLTGDLGSGAALAGTAPVSLIQNGYGREQEREADMFARDLLREHGYSTQPVADLFEKLRRDKGDVPGWLSTHPEHEERAAFFSQPDGTTPSSQ